MNRSTLPSIGADSSQGLSGTESWVRTFAGVVTALFCTFASFGMVIPVIPHLVTEKLGGSAFEVGVTFTLSGVVALLVRPFAGQLAQRRGSRPVMMLGAALIVVVAALYALPFGLPGLFGARLVMGVGEALLFTAGSVWTVALTPVDRRGQIVGFYGLAMWTGLTVGPIAGDAVFRLGSYTAVWISVAVLPAAAVLVLSFLPSSKPLGSNGVSTKLLPRPAVLPGLSLGCGAFGYAAVASFGALALTSRGIGHGSALISLFSVAYVLVRLVAGRFPDRIGALPVIVVSASVEAVGMVLIAFAPTLWVAGLGALISGGGFTLLYPALALITIDTAPEAERGAALGAITSFFDVAVGVAGLLGGALAEVSYTATFLMSAVAVLGSLFTGTIAARRRNQAMTTAID
ncbi:MULTISPECIES: MFS transporter [Streptomyces]|uniref:MFS transporter n=1 Tax=Streptomyces TaxID=1883 RepID=UPI00068F63BF|nr:MULTISPECIES: MFS transporter [Streptomyces]